MLQNRTPTGQEKTVQFAHTAATTAKVPVIANALAWIPMNDADADVLNAFYFEAQVSGVAKASGEAWSIGDALYWDATNKCLTRTTTSNTKCAHALAAAASSDTVSGLVFFNTFA